jgi:transaldolase
MTSNHLLEIKDYGQSIWMDHLNRTLIESGELKQLIETQGLRGLTSNPAIFESAIANNQIYDADIEAGIKAGKSVSEIYESLIFEDIRNACDLFAKIYEESGGLDGYVSIEVSPHLALDTEGTIEEALRFYHAIERENVMIKIPGTKEGIPAVARIISEGINVNVTLLFSVDSYENAAWAYIQGLEQRLAKNQPIDKIASVASFFLSRIDTKIDGYIDEKLKEIGTETLGEEARLNQVKGKVAIANAKIAYQKYQEIIASDRWKKLAEAGANIQRLLWASTSTKNPDYSDVMYIDQLVGKDTVNTLPFDTIQACADHCDPQGDRIETKIEEAYQLLESIQAADINIDLSRVMDELLAEGIDKFIQPFDSLMQSLDSKTKQLSSS